MGAARAESVRAESEMDAAEQELAEAEANLARTETHLVNSEQAIEHARAAVRLAEQAVHDGLDALACADQGLERALAAERAIDQAEGQLGDRRAILDRLRATYQEAETTARRTDRLVQRAARAEAAGQLLAADAQLELDERLDGLEAAG